jgi:hypothetical protein
VDDSKALWTEFHHDPRSLAYEAPAWFAADEDESAEAIEIVDELVWSDAGDEGERPREPEDAFLRLVDAVERAACSFGAGAETIALLRALLGMTRMEGMVPEPAALNALAGSGVVVESPAGVVRTERFTRQVLAWQDILRDCSDDYASCGAATLDEWTADLVTRALGGGSRQEAIRRELRKCGVAAFGLVAAA